MDLEAIWLSLPATIQFRIRRTETCWLWIGCLNGKGYGVFGRGGKRASRLVFEFANHVTLTWDDAVCHDCPTGDNPACVNPAHLFLGTRADNRADCINKNRQAKGERIFGAKLTAELVAEIRRKHADGRDTFSSIGRKYGVSRTAIRNIINGITWRHTHPTDPDQPLRDADDYFRAEEHGDGN